MADSVRKSWGYTAGAKSKNKFFDPATQTKGKTMNKSVWGVIAGVAVLAAVGAAAVPALAQTAEVKEKPRLYTYEASWTFPRARWGEVDKDNATSTQKALAPALSDGTLVGYGDDDVEVHTADGPTHDNWWQSYSMAGLMKVLEALGKGPSPTGSALILSSTKHWDQILVSRFYNWKPGSWKGAYGYSSIYKLKADAPNDAVELLSKRAFVPLLEKLLNDGTIVEYEIDEETVHTESPDRFFIYYLTPTADGLDKVNAAVRGAVREDPLLGPAFGSMVDFSAHRDMLTRGNATYK
jgi:hypothetical protein